MADKVFNPYTGRYVDPNGRTAKKYNLMSPKKMSPKKKESVLKAAPADFHEKKPLRRPVKSDDKTHKGMVYVKDSSKKDGKKLVRFGFKGMSDYTKHHDKKRRKNYLARSGGIRDKEGNLTKDDPKSANYWARRILW